MTLMGFTLSLTALRFGKEKARQAHDFAHAAVDHIGQMVDEAGRARPEAEAQRPEAFNLLSIYAALSDRSLADIVGRFAGGEFSAFKGELTELAVATIGPINAEMKRLLQHPDEIDAILSDGAARARSLALPILAEVEEIVGFVRS
jgi:tryptophanyl-tRNA synthetase